MEHRHQRVYGVCTRRSVKVEVEAAGHGERAVPHRASSSITEIQYGGWADSSTKPPSPYHTTLNQFATAP